MHNAWRFRECVYMKIYIHICVCFSFDITHSLETIDRNEHFFVAYFFSCSLTINKRKQVNIAYFSQRSQIIHMAVKTIVHKPYWIAEPIWRGKWFDTLLIALILALPQTQSFVKNFYIRYIYVFRTCWLSVYLLAAQVRAVSILNFIIIIVSLFSVADAMHCACAAHRS